LIFHNLTVFHLFLVFGFSGDERLICRVTGSRRFPPPNHATSFEVFLGEEKSGRGLPHSKTLRE